MDHNYRNCSRTNCIKCKDYKIQKMEQKLNKYKEVIDDLMDDSMINPSNNQDNHNYNPLEESMIIFKDDEGYYRKKIRSDVGESFLVFEDGLDVDELNKDERTAVKAQDDYRKYDKTCKQVQKYSGIYGWGVTIVSYGKWLVGLI